MKIMEIIQESVGRSSQHVEDLVYIEGPEAGMRALDRLQSLAEQPSSLSIKWDGSPALRFGRDENGQFHFADKHAREMVPTPEALKDLYLARAKNEPSESRIQFVNQMVQLHPVFEKATPPGFRGFVTADLLWRSRPPLVDGEFVFEPNTVRYRVDADSDMGQRIGQSRAGAAAVLFQDTFESSPVPIGDRWQELGSRDLVIVPPVSVITGQRADIDSQQFDRVRNHIQTHAKAISEFIEPERGLSDIRGILYHYINQQAAGGNVQQMESRFLDWLENSGKVSKNKAAKIQARAEANPGVVKALFHAVEATADLKRQLIDQLEDATLSTVGMKAELVTGDRGGEGFVDSGTGMKLVNRGSFSHANFSRNRS